MRRYWVHIDKRLLGGYVIIVAQDFKFHLGNLHKRVISRRWH